MKVVYYRQCRLERKNANGSVSIQTSYIPEPFCVLGKVLRLRGENRKWTDGWVVKEVSSHRREEPPDPHQEIKYHRRASGDSLPR